MRNGKAEAGPAREERCPCGNLVAKVSAEGVEILCRRCRRIHVIPWQGRGGPRAVQGGRAAARTR